MKVKDNLIGSTRTAIMGIAALWIMIFHGTIEVPLNGIMTFIKIGYLGVDIFMFMSGFSMYHSFKISGDCNYSEFIKRRLARILPTFIPFAIIWYIGYIFENYGTIELLQEGMCTKEFWITMLTFRWFVPCILFCYFITPIIQKVFDKFGFKYGTLVLMILPIIMGSFAFIGSSVALMFLLRIPTYIIGYFYGANEQKKIKLYPRVGIIILGYMVYYFLLKNYSDNYLCDTGLYWYPAIFISSSMIVCLAYLSTYVKSKWINFLGKYSLEVYLWHVFILYPCLQLMKNMELKLDSYGIIINLICIVLTIPISYVYAKIIKGLTGLFEKHRKKTK